MSEEKGKQAKIGIKKTIRTKATFNMQIPIKDKDYITINKAYIILIRSL